MTATITPDTDRLTTIWAADFSAGTSPMGVAEFVRVLTRDGAVGTGNKADGEAWRNVAGHPRELGIVAHDDFRWAATRFTEGSMAAYYENGDAFGGRWWEDDSMFSAGRAYGRKVGR